MEMLAHPSDPVWDIPIFIRTPTRSFYYLLKTQSASLQIPEMTAEGWALFNADQAGYYRVCYDQAALKGVLKQFDQFSAVEKNSIIQDVSLDAAFSP
jgi:hypothetical protein